ncbi:MAG: hypothetical protein U5K37_02720 [Natrialbaceae archaeon]|nr:hypothetical protein [Natrialbaceae archaeon]
MITLALAAWGIAASVYHPAGLTLCAATLSIDGRRSRYHWMAGNAGIAFGPLLTILLLGVFDWRTVTIWLALPAIAVAVLGLLIRFDETAAVEEVQRSPSILAGSRRIYSVGFLLVLAIVVCNGLYYRGMLTFLPDVLGGFVGDLGGLELASAGQYLYAGLLTRRYRWPVRRRPPRGPIQTGARPHRAVRRADHDRPAVCSGGSQWPRTARGGECRPRVRHVLHAARHSIDGCSSHASRGSWPLIRVRLRALGVRCCGWGCPGGYCTDGWNGSRVRFCWRLRPSTASASCWR